LVFVNRAALETMQNVLVIAKNDFGGERTVTDAVIANALASRPTEAIEGIVVLGAWTAWNGDPLSQPWRSVKCVDFTGSWMAQVGDSIKALPDYEVGGRRAFREYSGLVSVIFPDGVIGIGFASFNSCTSLKEVKFGSGLKKLGMVAFGSCSNLTSLILPDGFEEIGTGAFWDCTSLKELKVGKGFKKLGLGAFYGCSSLIGLSFPDGVEEIGHAAFYDCQSLKELKIGSGVKKLPDGACYNCSSLVSLILPEGLEVIGSDWEWIFAEEKGVFQNCSSLVELVLPRSVIRIASCAFKGCTSLRTLSLGRLCPDIRMGRKWGLSDSVRIIRRFED
jgi:hypothetical protein